jgi:hypothetical protein
MRTICRRLHRLEKALPRTASAGLRWGRLAGIRDQLLLIAKGRGALVAERLKADLEELGPHGLWLDMARYHLQLHGIVQSDHESFAEMMARALGIGMGDLRAQLEQGRLGTALMDRFPNTEQLPMEVFELAIAGNRLTDFRQRKSELLSVGITQPLI